MLDTHVLAADADGPREDYPDESAAVLAAEEAARVEEVVVGLDHAAHVGQVHAGQLDLGVQVVDAGQLLAEPRERLALLAAHLTRTKSKHGHKQARQTSLLLLGP